MMKRLIVLLFLVSSPVWATTWYVRPGGAGAADGTTYATAWSATSANAAWGTSILPGDTVYWAGRFQYNTTIPVGGVLVGSSGTSGSHITVRGDYPSDPGYIVAARKIASASFAAVGDGTYSVNVSNQCTNVVIGDPTLSTSKLLLHAASQVDCAATVGSFYLDTVPNPDVLYVHPYASIDDCYHNWVGACDLNGNDYIDFVNMNFYFGDGSNGTVRLCKSPDASGSDHVTFTNCMIKYGEYTGVYGNNQNCTNITFTTTTFECVPTGTYLIGFGAGTQHGPMTAQGCYFTSDEDVNDIYSNTSADRHAFGGQYVQNLTADHCQFVNWAGDGVLDWIGNSGGNMNDVTVTYCYFYNLHDALDQNCHQGVSMQGNNFAGYSDHAKRWVVHDCIFSLLDGDQANPNGFAGSGIRFKGGNYTTASDAPVCYHCDFDRNNAALYWQPSATDGGGCALTFKNNIIHNPNATGWLYYLNTYVTIHNIYIDFNNDYPDTQSKWNGSTKATFATWKSDSGQDFNSLLLDPLLVGNVPTAATDFYLQDGSPAYQTAVTTSYTPDYFGTVRPSHTSPDIGVYEFPVIPTPTPTPTPPAAGSVTLTIVKSAAINTTGRGICDYIFTWIAASDGSVSLALPSSTLVVGTIKEFETIPGTPAPSANYDITLTDSHGLDVLMGNGANRSATLTQVLIPFVGDATPHAYSHVPVDDALTFSVTNAGSGGQGILRVRTFQ